MVMGIGQDLSEVVDIVNRKKISSQRLRNEQIRQGITDPNSFEATNQPEIQQAQQPSEFWGAGRKVAENQNVPSDEFGLIDKMAPKLGGVRNYYGDTDWTTPKGLQSLYDTSGYTKYQEAIKVPDLWSNISRGNFRGPSYERAVEDAKRYAAAGFIPGKAPAGWTYIPGSIGPARGSYRGPDAGYWKQGNSYLGYRPGFGYNGTVDVGSQGDKEGIALVGSVISMMMPGLLAAGAGAGTGAGASGLAATPTELALDAGALGGANTGALGSASLGTPGLLGSGGIFGTGVDIGNVYANQLAENILKNAATGGDIKKSTLGSLFGMASGTMGNQVSSMLSPQLGETVAKMMGGAASGGISSLYNKDSPIAGSLYGAMSGGLHGFLNSTARDQNMFSPLMDTNNRKNAQQITSLAKTLMKLRKK